MNDLDLSKITLRDKARLLTGRDLWTTTPLPEHGIRALCVADGPHGLRKPAASTQIGLDESLPATCFPTASALGASWDAELVRAIGRAIGLEARAAQVDVVLGPGLNLKRHPFCGRNFEYFSEDPLLSGVLAAAMVEGIQSAGVGACLKHFVANNQETRRMVLDVRVDERALRELYLASFEHALARCDPATIMAAYNKVNGVYCCAHTHLLDEVLRGAFGFRGLVVSDWGAVDQRVPALRAGLDLEMPSTRQAHTEHLVAAAREGELDVADLDRSVARLLTLLERTAPDPTAPPPHVDYARHHALARRAAAASAVLLKNEHGVLPLPRDSSVAVLGAFAQEPRYQGAGSSRVTPTQVSSLLDALGGDVRYAPGYARHEDAPQPDLIRAAADLSARVEVAIVVAGLPESYESESFDRTHLRLPLSHVDLIEAVAARAKRTVLVLMNGAPVEMPWANRVDAIIEAHLGGQAGGLGLADVLLGRSDPGGRLAETFPHRPEDLAAHAAFPGEGHQVRYVEGLYVGYRFTESADTDVLFPFGHGLSYTTYAYDELSLSADMLSGDEALQVRVEVENTGPRPGSEVVQVYVRPEDPALWRPHTELVGFEKIELEPGERTTVRVELSRRAFAHYDPRARAWLVEPGRYVVEVGRSVRDIRQRAVCTHTGDALAARDSAPSAPEVYASPALPFTPSGAEVRWLLGQELPAGEPLRPFHRNSLMGEVRAVWLGRILCALARGVALKHLGAEGDPALERMADAMVEELPLRAMVQTAGALSYAQLDALISALNGHPVDAVLRILGVRTTAAPAPAQGARRPPPGQTGS
ncbi:MAG: glycoside hydrolase family 3 C-terminal domain-containing protein [Myxococcota bacterium]